MRRARSSVDDAPIRSPRDISVRAWVTSERVAGERWFSRVGAGSCAGGGCGVGSAAAAAGGNGLREVGPVGRDMEGEGLGSGGRDDNIEQPPSTSTAPSPGASLLSERFS